MAKPFKVEQWLGDNEPQLSFDFGEYKPRMLMHIWHTGDSDSCLEMMIKGAGKRYNKDLWYKVIGYWKKDGDVWR